ncbi:unnamed protein product [Adineta ricciae]|uniref:G-protein coupled receptors family 1 profile domain-containing protein n=1 Tax=Adineta ricciae TaxID=249248 RepID=A0A815PPF6_ADIRI|nr:unnamed protein product [Adineta ricciae]CAF1468687.1 unnamed protein product [Adineta ricciae]
MTSNSTIINMTTFTVTNSIGIIDVIIAKFVNYLPLLFVILGLIGFVGNVFTYLQRELRSNTCCIYSLCGSIADIIHILLNLFPNYLKLSHGISVPWLRLTYLCPLQMMSLVFFPHLSLNFLLMAVIDRYASTCRLTSRMSRLSQLKMVPLCIIIPILTSCLASMRNLVLYEYRNTSGCTITQPLTNTLLYISINGLMQPTIMFIFVILTFRNVRKSRQLVVPIRRYTIPDTFRRSRNQFITMIFAQILTTALLSLQWTMVFSLTYIFIGGLINLKPGTLLYSFYLLSNCCYYLNNVKAFYLSLLTSRVFRETFLRTLIKCKNICFRHQ